MQTYIWIKKNLLCVLKRSLLVQYRLILQAVVSEEEIATTALERARALGEVLKMFDVFSQRPADLKRRGHTKNTSLL